MFFLILNVNNLNFNICNAEQLKYSDKKFDIVTCRTAAHHFIEVEKFCCEVHRVLKDEGEFIIVDTITSDQIKLNNWHQEVELIRDKSHIKNLSLIEWKNLLKKTNFYIKDIIQSRVTMNLNDWMERSGTSENDKKILAIYCKTSNEKNPSQLNLVSYIYSLLFYLESNLYQHYFQFLLDLLLQLVSFSFFYLNLNLKNVLWHKN